MKLVGYMRVSKADGSQVLDMQKDALIAAGVPEGKIWEDKASGAKDDRPGLAACLKSLDEGDVLVIWRLDRLGRNLKHLVETVEELGKRGISFKVITGAPIDTTTPQGKLMFGIFAALAVFERDVIRERTMAGLDAARARGRHGGRKPVLTASKLMRAQAAMKSRDTNVTELCEELGVSRTTLYAHVTPTGEFTKKGQALLKAKGNGRASVTSKAAA
jgi:DNA invertase Pin-like site-specific DNA recombinase